MEHDEWPALALADWEPTYQTLHRWTQIVGKVQLALAPRLNHWWHVAQRVSSRGLETGTLCGEHDLTLAFDFVGHRVVAETGDGRVLSFPLEPMSVAVFYDRMLALLGRLGLAVPMWPVPVEMNERTPFREDLKHASYDRSAAARLHRVLLSTNHVFNVHRGRFLGKSSPSHFFWGGFDLAVTRFSGRRNPSPPPGLVNREAYSHEVISHGFWPGGDFLDRGRVEEPVFYAYALPEPQGFRGATIAPPAARYDAKFGEYLLPYEAVRTARDPAATLLSFMETTYLAAARPAGWSVEELRAPASDGAGAERAASALI